ncbi:hypothetical protein [Soonwooa sp.]|uniref:hypothetical protein n=1 Tax=Soonwooa sp. TaxID=1938592 RepID=UPI0028A5B46C|nr:hypothetical protein [Soonwooa sp.]
MDFIDDDHIGDYLQDDYIENLIYDRFAYTEEELHKIIADYESKIPYKNEIDRIAFTLFSGEMTRLKLLDYFIDNFNQTNKSFTDLTKFNQIFYFLNKYQKISKERYKQLVSKKYNFDYGRRDIKGETLTHQTTLKNLEILFNSNESQQE